MANEKDKETGDNLSPVSSDHKIFESLNYPTCIIGTDGIIKYGNGAFNDLFGEKEEEIKLDWTQPLALEYRKRVATAYLSAIKGTEKHCFAVINLPDGSQKPIEIFLFPMYSEGEVSSILTLIKIVDKRLLSFDKSILSLISEENFQYDRLFYEFSPIPVIRINEKFEIVKMSRSAEGLLGLSSYEEQMIQDLKIETFFPTTFESVKKYIKTIIDGDITFKRLGEVKIVNSEGTKKVVNLVIYPIILDNEIAAIELILEDVTRMIALRDELNTVKRDRLLRNIAKGFLHTLNNTINVIMSKTQLLLQITEKESVIEGIRMIEDATNEIADETRRVENFLRDRKELPEEKIEPIIDIIEDAIDFSKMQFKVEDKDKKRSININKKYFTSANIKTDGSLLKEILISIILRVSIFILKKGTIEITLKQNNDLFIQVKVNKEILPGTAVPQLGSSSLYPGINIRQAAEKLKLKIIEEESLESYAIKTIFPSKVIFDTKEKIPKDEKFKLRDFSILIAEDEEALQKILYELFDRMGNRVFISNNGDEALAEFKRSTYDLVITDYDIEGLTGIELAARVKELDENTVTVLLSGWMLNNLDAYKNVIDLFLPKPFKLDSLLTEISKLVKDIKPKRII
jgi:PAS domain S-box-containing protein